MKRLLAILIALPQIIFAHAGCHEAPGGERAPHGGVLEHTESILVELVDTEDPMEIYVLDGHLHPMSTSHLNATATLQLPRRGGKGTVSLIKKQDHFEAHVNLTGRVHRYTLQLSIETPEGREDVQFQVEPQ